MKAIIRALQEGRSVTFKPRGNSMYPVIKSGEEVTVEPVAPEDVHVGDIVLVKVAGSVYLHKVGAETITGVRIENNRGHINGWTSRTQVFGRKV